MASLLSGQLHLDNDVMMHWHNLEYTSAKLQPGEKLNHQVSAQTKLSAAVELLFKQWASSGLWVPRVLRIQAKKAAFKGVFKVGQFLFDLLESPKCSLQRMQP